MTRTSGNVSTIVEILRRQFEPTLEMLRRAIQECSDEVWDAKDEEAPFWQQAYHTLFWLDFWLSDPDEGFEPPSFHGRDAVALVQTSCPSFSREQIEGYLEEVYAKCGKLLDGLTLDALDQESQISGKRWTVGDRLLGQLRHVQHHVGYMNCMLRRKAGSAPGWIGFNE